ncbi:MAG: type II toxin-antitoxin system HicB family antitoxin [Anaerolineae bacterium]|nr:type II toxin-antitoxin system HicB family antitoxin [Anaerolineae bacterium]
MKLNAKKSAQFKVIFEPGKEGGYTVHVPALPECVGEGKTVEEAMVDIQKAVARYYLKTLRSENGKDRCYDG